MLLLVLHASVAYMVTPLGSLWPFKDVSTHLAFDVVGSFIHTFRLPLFFVMAGFFGAKLHHERGARNFVQNRLRRIGIPLVVFWVLLAPLILVPFAYYRLDPASRTVTGLGSWLLSADARSHLHFFHLWFLFDLLVYYGAMLIIIQFARLTRWAWADSSRQRLGLLLQRPWSLFLFVAVTVLSLLPMRLGMLETPATFARPVSTLSADFLFFLFGWGLYAPGGLTGHFSRHPWRCTLFGMGFFVAHLVCVSSMLAGNSALHIPSVVFASFAIWLLIYGLIGLFIRYCNGPNRVWRYIADSSYWCYLVHLPLVAWLQVLLANWGVPAIVKYMVVLGTTMVICLLSYDRLVRSTAVGALINGRRRP